MSGRRSMMRLLIAALAASLSAAPARAEAPVDSGGRQEPLPSALANVGITEHLDARIPEDASFTDENGKPVRIGDYFGSRPVLLNLGYFTCPMLCGLVLNGILESIKEIDWAAGEEFEIVTLSIDPSETTALAKLKKQNAIQEYGRPEAAAGWHFLTGDESDIRAVTDAVGFTYAYDSDQGQFVHPAAIIVLTPDGRVSRYLYGVQYDPKTLRLSLLEASEGKVGSTIDKIILYCYHYDATEGRYAPAAMKIMRGGGLLAVLALGITLAVLWKRDAGRRRNA